MLPCSRGFLRVFSSAHAEKDFPYMPSPVPESAPYIPSCSSPSVRFTRFADSVDAEDLPDSGSLWVVLGDIHGCIRRVGDIPELEKAAGVILTGDLTTLGGVAAARTVIEAFHAVNPVILAQIGNMDRAEVNDWLEASGINLHRNVRELSPEVALLGVGGSTFSPFGTPSEFPEARFSEWLEELARRAAPYREMVLVAHNPPYNTVCDRTDGGLHVGSTAIRDFIEEYQPAACLCGHIHESAGIQRVGRTLVVNPGSFSTGGYALFSLARSGLKVALRRLEN